ncbi:MAG: lysine--tRNA ligase [bacterium]
MIDPKNKNPENSQELTPGLTPETTINTKEKESEEHAIRLGKVTKMHQENTQAWPEAQKVTATSQQALEEYEKTKSETQEYMLAGRLITIRDHGKSFFGNIQDRSGMLQVYIKMSDVGDAAFEHFKRNIDLGDHLWVRGTLFTTKTGQVTLKVAEFKLISKCLRPLPEKYHGLVDTEQRYRQRYLDLMSNPERKEKFIKRSKIIQSIRAFLQNHDFIEVETPMLQPIPGGATARPFITHHNAYNIDLFLRIAPELYLKRLVVGGIERVFEINRNFRNEGVSTRHNPEFTMLEYYMAHGNYKDGIKLTEELIHDAVVKNFGTEEIIYQDLTLNFKAPFKCLSMKDSLIEIGGLTADQITEKNIDSVIKQNKIELAGTQSYGVKLFALFEHLVEAKIIQPTFITEYPVEVSPLAKRNPHNPAITDRCELFAAGMEVANMFSELNDPIDQAERFKSQVQARDAGDQEAHHYDADYVTALEYGLPPCVGVGIGIDRLVMLLTNTSSIKDVILFPTMKKQ